MDTRRVLLVGDSLVLAGLQASLGTFPNLEIMTLDSLSAREKTRDLSADVVIYDRSATGIESLLAAAQADPGLLLIGVDPANDGLLVTASREQRCIGMCGLLALINGMERGGRGRHSESDSQNTNLATNDQSRTEIKGEAQ